MYKLNVPRLKFTLFNNIGSFSSLGQRGVGAGVGIEPVYHSIGIDQTESADFFFSVAVKPVEFTVFTIYIGGD